MRVSLRDMKRFSKLILIAIVVLQTAIKLLLVTRDRISFRYCYEDNDYDRVLNMPKTTHHQLRN